MAWQLIKQGNKQSFKTVNKLLFKTGAKLVFFKQLRTVKEGSALLLAFFIITSIIVIAMGGASLALSGIKMAGTQSQSTKAYFVAEAGAERLLYEVRQSQTISLASDLGLVIEPEAIDVSGATYWVYFTAKRPYDLENVFTSLGSFLNTRRSVDLRF